MSEAPQTPPPPPEQPPTGGPDEPGGSRNPWTFLAVGAGVIVLAVILFLVLRPDDDGEEGANTTPTAQTTTSVETTTEATTESTTTVETTTEQVTTTVPPADRPERIVIEVENAQPVGGAQRYEVDEGKQVVLVIRSDVEDEVHLHGYDLSTEVAPGQTGRIRFRATDPGEFEIELEQRAVPIGELVVS